jgi:hypothetical protein
MGLSIDLVVENEDILYDCNITHNLGKMADAAGIYQVLWRPEELGFTKAGQIVEILAEGVAQLATEKAKFEAYDSPNGWGLHKHFLPFCVNYLAACKEFPEAIIHVSR